MTFKDFRKRVESGKADGNVKNLVRMSIEEYEEISQLQQMQKFEKTRIDSDRARAVLCVLVVLSVFFSILTDMIIESILFSIVIAFFFGVASEHYSK